MMAATFPEAIAQGYGFLCEGLDHQGVPRVLVSFDPLLREPIAAADVRTRLRQDLGLDIGFEVGDETFSAMLALMLLRPDRATLDIPAILQPIILKQEQRRRFRFFFDNDGFPADTDCTAVAAGALWDRGAISAPELTGYAGELLTAAAGNDPGTSEQDGSVREGVIMVYWQDPADSHAVAHGRKHDAVACANALYVLKHARRQGLRDPHGTTETTMRYVTDHLASGLYRQGTRYYPSPTAFLFAASRLCRTFEDCPRTLLHELHAAVALLDPLASRVPDIQSGNALDLAMWILAAGNIGWEGALSAHRQQLLRHQRADGSWPAHAYYRLGRLPVYFGSATVTTIFAVAALDGL